MYIVFEGVVGSGKSTQSKRLLAYLKQKYPQKEIILTREPGGSEIAEMIRTVVQGTDFDEDMTPECEAYLYAASRAQTLRSVVRPVLDRGGIVIADRSYLTSIAYQGAARDLGRDTVLKINQVAVDGIRPDIVIYMDIDPKKGLARTFDEEGDKFEKESEDFFLEVEKGYKTLAKDWQGTWLNIDASGTLDEVFYEIKEMINPLT